MGPAGCGNGLLVFLRLADGRAFGPVAHPLDAAFLAFLHPQQLGPDLPEGERWARQQGQTHGPTNDVFDIGIDDGRRNAGG